MRHDGVRRGEQERQLCPSSMSMINMIIFSLSLVRVGCAAQARRGAQGAGEMSKREVLSVRVPGCGFHKVNSIDKKRGCLTIFEACDLPLGDDLHSMLAQR